MLSVTRLSIVGVIGSGSEAHEDLAAPLGSWLATQDAHLVTGAGQGVMAAVSKAFADTPGRKGLVLGIVPGSAANHMSGSVRSAAGKRRPYRDLLFRP